MVKFIKSFFVSSEYASVLWFAKQLVWELGNALDERLCGLEDEVSETSLDVTNGYQRKKFIMRYIVTANDYFRNQQNTAHLFVV